MTTKHKSILLLILAAALSRVLFSFIFPPLVTPDSQSYLQMARMLGSGDFSGYDGARTPFYPLVILLFQVNIPAVVIFQHVLGILICLALYRIFGALFKAESAGLAAGFSYALNPSQIVIEKTLLTETSAAFLVTLSVFLLFAGFAKNKKLFYLFSAGVLSSLAALVKPLFLFLPVMFALVATLRCFLLSGRKSLFSASGLAPVLLPAVFILGGWSLFNYRQAGYFGVSSMGGLCLINHVGDIIEAAPPEYDTIKKIFIKYREKRVQETGNSSNTYYLAREELLEKTHFTNIELSQKLTEIAKYLILHHPLSYSKSVARAFAEFWLPTWYTGQGGVRAVLRSGDRPMVLLVGSFILVHLACMSAFFILPLAWLASSLVRKALSFNFELCVIYSVVFSTAILQALMQYGENSRYKLPVEPLIVATVLAALAVLARAFYRKPGSLPGD